MNLPNVFKKLPYQDDIVLRARQILRKIMPEDNWKNTGTGTEYLYPNGNAEGPREWTEQGVQGPCDFTVWDLVDDVWNTPDDDVTYAEPCDAGLTTQQHLFPLTDCADPILTGGAPIQSILVQERVKGFTVEDKEYITRLKIGGAFHAGITHAIGNTGGSYVDKNDTWALNPETSTAWTVAVLDALKVEGIIVGNSPVAPLPDMRVTQIFVKVTFENRVTTITQPSGRVRFERLLAGGADHEINNTITSEDWSDYTHLRFKIEKVTYAGAVRLKVGVYSGGTLYSVFVGDYCKFDDTTTDILCVIPLAHFVTLGADQTDITGVGFTADGDGGDYDFYIDGLEAVALTDEGNDEYEAPIDKTIKGFADVGTGVQVPAEMGEVTERSATFYIPKDTIIDKDDRIVFNSEVYIVTGINDSYDTHILVEAVLLEVWDESNLP